MDAFALLKQASKRAATPSKSAQSTKRRPKSSTVPCPICETEISECKINHHLDTVHFKVSSGEHRASPSSTLYQWQPSLHEFFGGKDVTVPTFFCLNFDSRTAELRRSITNSDFVVLDRFYATGIAGTRPFLLCINDSHIERRLGLSDSVEYYSKLCHKVFPVNASCSNRPLLKSHLQKAIRRCRPFQAVWSVWQIICARETSSDTLRCLEVFEGFNEVLRRLPIIMLEDVLLHAQFPTLVWWMVYVSRVVSLIKSHSASFSNNNSNMQRVSTTDENSQSTQNSSYDKDGFAIVRNETWIRMTRWLLAFTEWMASCPERDIIENALADEEEAEILLSFPDAHTLKNVEICTEYITELPDRFKNLLYCLALRKSFGGMKGDQAMLSTSIRVFYNRFQEFVAKDKDGISSKHSPRLFPYPIDCTPPQLTCRLFHHLDHWLTQQSPPVPVGLQENDWILNAIDYHVSPVCRMLWFQLVSSEEELTEKEEQLLLDLRQQYGSNDMDFLNAIKTVMWFCSSAVNYKLIVNRHGVAVAPLEVNEEYKVIWAPIEDRFMRIAKRHLRKQYIQNR